MMALARFIFLLCSLAVAGAGAAHASGEEKPRDIIYQAAPPAPSSQSREEAAAKSVGCQSCHISSDAASMHSSPGVVLGCVDCHGGSAEVRKPEGAAKGDAAYFAAQEKAHVLPTLPNSWHYPSSANPKGSYTLLNREAPEYVRFVNPSDYRAADLACGNCHADIIIRAKRSIMATGALLWGGASYNNGILPFKKYFLGEVYDNRGGTARLEAMDDVTPEMEARGVRPQMLPLPAWEVIPPGDIFRVFERGGRNIGTQFPEVGLPNSTGLFQRLEEPGRPDQKQSMRGPGTGLRIAVPVINIHKTRLNDPLMWFLGTNDNPGDYRTSGCGACHVPYANDRDPFHSGPYARDGNTGLTQTSDPVIPKDEPGHPIRHAFTQAIPTAQCMNCHMHQPNIFVNSFLGYTMWDYESDAPFMWPEKQRYPTNTEMFEALERNPEGAVVRGKWSDPGFLRDVSLLNSKLKDTQFADYHGHGWNFRAVFKRDRKGELLDAKGAIVPQDDPDKFRKAVHLKSIHLEKGMQCVDCHYEQDVHGDGHLYGEVAAAIEVRCDDCHGTAQRYPSLRTSGPAAKGTGNDLSLAYTPFGKRRFQWMEGKLFQRSMVDPNLEWELTLVKDTVNPGHKKYNPRAARAKTMSKLGTGGKPFTWGHGVQPKDLAHQDDKMECFTCHLSWTTSCAGCHLPIEANWKTPRHHFEGGETRNYATYNPQVARDDMFQLGVNASVKGNTIAPVRSSSALVLSSTNINRERLYVQQPPIAASGYSSQAFAPHYPHTERKTETKTCTDCHLSDANDNNAIMAQLLLQGTNFVNFVGFNAYVGGEGGLEAVRITEWEEPQAVIGSYLHRYAYPDWFKAHQDRLQELPEAYTQKSGDVGCLQLRGEYLYVAEGAGGFRAYDVNAIANKGFSDRIVGAPFSPLGHDTSIKSKNATCMALPTNQNINILKNEGDLILKTNQEQKMHEIYRYAFITDAEEGLIATDVTSLADGDPRNNFFKRALTWNPEGVLTGARHITIAGDIFYITTPSQIVVLDMADPLKPQVAARIPMSDPRATAVQFRYLFVTTARGLEMVDVTDPRKPALFPGALVPMGDARRVYVARTFAYVAAGADGLMIADVENPEKPKFYMQYNADGKINDARDVTVGSTNASLFAYVADGKNGLKVVQLTSPASQPRFYGFSPEPKPELIAWRKTRAPAAAVSKGLDRDRAVDETGGQIAVFGRLGSRPFTLEEQKRFYLGLDGAPFFVNDRVDPTVTKKSAR
ncbi:MAG: hypothetical protein EXR08_04570 [Alphaproteobacteria bacterium]|nr:hypothetical protein [Alphaproteobacteria bacterium]